MSTSSPELSRLRSDLDPAFSYIILERERSRAEKDDLAGLLARLSIPILETKTHEDPVHGRLFLVAKLDPARAGEISREYVSVNLPENVTCLFYGSLTFKQKEE